MRQINKIIVHCSDSDIPAHDDIETIRKWHVLENGWSDVGYHYFIQSNGNIQKGRDEARPGAHTRGHNQDSIGICLHGKNEFADTQFFALNTVIRSLLYAFPKAEIYGHRDFDNNKTCPNFDVNEKLNILDIPEKLKRINPKKI